jgi:hypothetical protein
MKVRPISPSAPGWDRVSKRLKHWQSVRTWAWLIREAEALWSEDARFLQRLGAAELLQVVQEVPPETAAPGQPLARTFSCSDAAAVNLSEIGNHGTYLSMGQSRKKVIKKPLRGKERF